MLINAEMQKIYEENTHLLIAGTTGSGKSTLLNSLIYTILGNPERCKFWMIDPKRVELALYKDLNIVEGYATESKQACIMLKNLIDEMEARYKVLEKKGLRNCRYKLPHIYLVIDEIADLMLTAKKQFQPLLQRILALGRAANITVIAATQIPNRKVIPAELACNFPQKIGLRCISPIESRQIIGQKGCEYLKKYGSGLWLSSDGIEQINIPLTSDSDLISRIEESNQREKEFLKLEKQEKKIYINF